MAKCFSRLLAWNYLEIDIKKSCGPIIYDLVCKYHKKEVKDIVEKMYFEVMNMLEQERYKLLDVSYILNLIGSKKNLVSVMMSVKDVYVWRGKVDTKHRNVLI